MTSKRLPNLHPEPGGNGCPERSLEDVLTDARDWLAEHPYSEVTIRRTNGAVDLERKKKERFNVGI